jgi:hypothetical protein
MRTAFLLALALDLGFAYVVGRSADSPHNELKWRPMPAQLNYHLWNGRPVNSPTSCQAAMQEWNDELRTNFVYALSTETGTNSVAADGQNVVCWNDMGTGWALAANYFWYSSSSGNLIESDIKVNTAFSWCYSGTPGSGQFDFWDVMAHELGHSLCLADLYDLNPPANAEKTMYGYCADAETKKRTLEQDDKDGIAYLYPINANDQVWVRDGNGTLDDGSVPYPGSPFWLSPDIQLNPDPPRIGMSCQVKVIARNLRPVSQSARIILEVHDPDVSLKARTGVLWADTFLGMTIPPGNADPDLDGEDEYANKKGDGETTYVFNWTPTTNRFSEGHYCIIATVETGTDVLVNSDPRLDNDAAQRNFHITPAVPAGVAETLAVEAGNPTGQAVTRRLTFTFEGQDSGWTRAIVPPDTALVLTAADTFVPLKVVVTSPGGASIGESHNLRLKSFLTRNPTGETLLCGGLNWRLTVAQSGDVGATRILAPRDTVLQGTSITPSCSLRNFGATNASYYARMRIGDYYDEDVYVAGHGPGTNRLVTFPTWIAAQPGTQAVSCSTLLDLDVSRANDKTTGSVTVRVVITPGWTQRSQVPAGANAKTVKDGGCLACAQESGNDIVYGLKGNNTAEFYSHNALTNTWTALAGIPLYTPLGRKKTVKKGACIAQTEGRVYAGKGNNTLEFYEFQPGANTWITRATVPGGAVKQGAGAAGVKRGDTTWIYLLKGSNTLEFYRYNTGESNWQTLASAPAGLSGRMFKDGSCLAYREAGGTIYALKGSYNEFYAYDVASGTWTTKAPLPLIGSSGRKKKAKSGAALAALGDYVYCLKGGNTREFWRYHPGSDAWLQQDDIPLGLGKAVKGGGALAAGADKLYALKGNSTIEFWQYQPPAPGGHDPIRFGSGSCPLPAAGELAHPRHLTLAVAPNPFSGSALISYELPEAGNASLKLYDVTGVLVTTLVQGYHAAGSSSFITHRSSFARGIYLLKLETETRTTTSKLIIE